MKSNALIIFTRIPIAGKTKTRLQSKLSPEECADIHKCFLKDMNKEIADLKSYDIDIVISYSPEGDLDILREIFSNRLLYMRQEGINIIEKMYDSMKKILSFDYEKCILIGTDIPEVSKENIISAFDLLNDNDFIFGPSYDGGYYLVGMKEYNDIILNSKSGMLDDIISELKNNNLKYSLLEMKHDIDEYEDLLSLAQRIEKNEVKLENTEKFLKNLEKRFKNNNGCICDNTYS